MGCELPYGLKSRQRLKSSRARLSRHLGGVLVERPSPTVAGRRQLWRTKVKSRLTSFVISGRIWHRCGKD